MSEQKKKGYRSTLNLPKTSFSMKANLTQREPGMQKQWEKARLYDKTREFCKGRDLYILHDGPPYANGDIHMGHVINKVLKDFVVRYKTMQGFDAPFIPGWDCHGLPIEAKVMTELGEQAANLSKEDIRKRCYKYASKFVKLQSKQFRQLGVIGDYDNPYLTFKPQYEAGILEVFAELVGKGLVHKQLKPIHWSLGCETALAEAELEYQDIESPAIMVHFPLTEGSVASLIEKGLVTSEETADASVGMMIWTTTPWTLAANLAVAVNPAMEYVALKYEQNNKRKIAIVAVSRLEAIVADGGLEEGAYQVSETRVMGSDLEGQRYRHPFVEHNPTENDCWMVIGANFVTAEDGTGSVHIAPGHGTDDYIAGQKYNLAIYSPVKDDGCYDDTVPEWLRGINVMQVDAIVNERLRNDGFLFSEKKLMHSYPHCWRSKKPVIFRATEQWFVSVDREIDEYGKNLRQLAIESTPGVQWIPAWGQKRIEGMLDSRPDWCISRQRSWGLPIPVFLNANGESLLTKESVLAVAKHVGRKGSNAWFTDSPKEILGEDFALPDGWTFDELKKEENIFDVWFESGCSWYSVVKQAGWPVPVDLYLEGSDQHRGWFQLSLLPALGATGAPPFKRVLTHGFTVDEKGMKQSKSLGNFVSAQEEVKKYGADILRLWVSSVNYQEDIRCNDEIIGRTQEAYRKIRNTLRYLFGNLNGFNPTENSVPYEEMFEIDRWAMQQLQKLIAVVHDSYEAFTFHKVFGQIYGFCVVEMSSIYMDVLKDRLYCDAADSKSRHSAQTAMHKILDALIRLLAPILVHTSEEAWAAMEERSDGDTVHLTQTAHIDEAIDWRADENKWNVLMDLRDKVLGVLEELRKEKAIASNQEAKVTIQLSDEQQTAIVTEFGAEAFASLCIVSEVDLFPGATETKITAEKCTHQKCERCWNYWPSVGANPEKPDLCERCANVVAAMDQ